MIYYICPVCDYNQMTEPPEDFYICPCCGTEFGNDDFDTSHIELRKQWIDNGMKWFSRYTPKPFGWDAGEQIGIFVKTISLNIDNVEDTPDAKDDLYKPIRNISAYKLHFPVSFADA